MFYFLHRMVKWFFTALIAAGLYWAWLQREALEPVYVWFDVYENGGLKNDRTLHKIRGKVLAVEGGLTFPMFQDGRTLAVTLVGLKLPDPPFSNTDLERAKERRRFLREAMLSKEVDVQITYAAPGSILGIVTAGGTNINLYLITNNLAQFNPEWIKGIPRNHQYQFFAAERLREKQMDPQQAALAAISSTNY